MKCRGRQHTLLRANCTKFPWVGSTFYRQTRECQNDATLAYSLVPRSKRIGLETRPIRPPGQRWTLIAACALFGNQADFPHSMHTWHTYPCMMSGTTSGKLVYWNFCSVESMWTYESSLHLRLCAFTASVYFWGVLPTSLCSVFLVPTCPVLYCNHRFPVSHMCVKGMASGLCIWDSR